jgi:2-polyprenyl-3-methyl-5-hydroxy-6-metoxy-1,4-benzoquinol methylase
MSKENYIKPEEYAELEEYSKIYSNVIARFLHGKRFQTINRLFRKYYASGKSAIDVSCGFCEWNIDKINIKGLDVNRKALEIAKRKGRIAEIIEADALKTGLKSESLDIVVCSQVLEHMQEPSELLKEIKRIMKKDAILIIAVPYDTLISLWKPLFFARCFIEGTIKRNKYFLKSGGHVNNFSPKTLAKLLRKNGFKILEIVNDYKFCITVVAQKI